MAEPEVIDLSDSDEEEKAGPSKPSVAPKPKGLGFQRNPSGQATLTFAGKRLKKKSRPHQEFRPDNLANSSLTIQPISAHFRSNSNRPNSRNTEEKVKISISKVSRVQSGGNTTEVKIVLHDQTSSSAAKMTAVKPKKTARKSMRYFAPSEELPVAMAEEPEVVDLDDEDDEEDPTDGRGSQVKRPLEVKEEEVEPFPKKVKLEEEQPEAVEKKTWEKSVSIGTETKVKEVPNLVAEKALDKFESECKKVLPEDEFNAVKKKLAKRRVTLPAEYLSAEKLKVFIDKQSVKLQEDRAGIYVHIKDLLDELLRCSKAPLTAVKKKATIVPVQRDEPKESIQVAGPSSQEEVPIEKPHKQASLKHIRKLERALKECHAAIRRMEEAECDLDDDESSYLRLSKYKKKCVDIYKKLAELQGMERDLGRRQDRKFRFEGSRIPEINAKIEKFINRRKGKGQEYFPDYADILQLFKTTNKEKNLGMNNERLVHEAQNTFTAIGEKLKSRRIHDDEENFNSYLAPEQVVQDPAMSNPEMEKKLKDSLAEGKEKIGLVIADFAQKQVEGGDQDEDDVEDGNDEEQVEEDDNEEEDKEDSSSLEEDDDHSDEDKSAMKVDDQNQEEKATMEGDDDQTLEKETDDDISEETEEDTEETSSQGDDPTTEDNGESMENEIALEGEPQFQALENAAEAIDDGIKEKGDQEPAKNVETEPEVVSLTESTEGSSVEELEN